MKGFSKRKAEEANLDAASESGNIPDESGTPKSGQGSAPADASVEVELSDRSLSTKAIQIKGAPMAKNPTQALKAIEGSEKELGDALCVACKGCLVYRCHGS